MPNRAKAGETRSDTAKIDWYEIDPLEQVFADGVGSTSFTGALARIDFFRLEIPRGRLEPGKVGTMVKVGEDIEDRTVHLRVLMPTATLLEFCVNTIAQLSPDVMKTILDSERTRIDTAFESLKKVQQ